MLPLLLPFVSTRRPWRSAPPSTALGAHASGTSCGERCLRCGTVRQTRAAGHSAGAQQRGRRTVVRPLFDLSVAPVNNLRFVRRLGGGRQRVRPLAAGLFPHVAELQRAAAATPKRLRRYPIGMTALPAAVRSGLPPRQNRHPIGGPRSSVTSVVQGGAAGLQVAL